MRVPLSWLRELVDVDVPTQELADRLSLTGSAVDKIERFGDGVSGIVVGRVLEVEDVPESDKLCVSVVDVGTDRVQIVAGAKNFRKDDLVPVALPGATVTTLDVPVGTRKMVGGKYESQGMLCSARELGVTDEHEGILVLGDGAQVGGAVTEFLGLGDDVLEFEIYPNRPDQMSVLGIAREVALLYRTPLRHPDTSVMEEGTPASTSTSVTIDDARGCPRYLARVIEDVRFAPSPALVQARLSACGFRPLGNLVDATNYVLLLLGQPLHAFDMDKLAEQRIVVRNARTGERIVTLDGEDRELRDTDLVIADAQAAQAIAGVMGGADSEVGRETKRVLLESAYFDPIRISRTSRGHHMRTEASARFERGADARMVPDAAALAAELMRTWAGGRVASGAVDEGGPPELKRMTLRAERIATVLGIEVPTAETERLLTGLGCEVSQTDSRLDVVAPSWRPDLEREVDLIEELARLYGYETIPAEDRPGFRGGRTPRQQLRDRLREVLLGAGLSEATLPSFVAAPDIEAIAYDGEVVCVANPMTADQRQLRPSLFPGLLRAAQRNVAHGVSDVRLFEFGKIFRGWAEGEDLPNETEHVAMLLVGNMSAHWAEPRRAADSFDMKGIIELALRELGVEDWTLEPDAQMLFHPGRSANVFVDGELVGRFGEIKPSVARAFDLDAAVVGGLSLAPLLARARETLRVASLATQPPVLRDISMWVPVDVAAGDVLATISSAGGEHLERVELVDEYRPESEERRSLAFALTFRAPGRTLRAEEADAARSAIAEACRDRHGAEIR